MPKVHVERSIAIKASSQKVYESLLDFQQWPKWSPWLMLESGVKLTYAQDGLSYDWEGQRIGAGGMQVEGSQPNRLITYRLQFLKPYKSKAKISFELADLDQACQVTWKMDTSLPFFLGWMKKSLVANLNSDYQRGLLLLKDYMEKGEAPSVLHEEGRVQYPGCRYVGITTECQIAEMTDTMATDMKELSFWVDDEELEIQGEPFTIYHKMDRIKNECAFTVAVPVAEVPADLPSPFHGGKIPALSAVKIVHEGPYHHLANAWAMGQTMIQNKEMKPVKGYPPFEVYLNDPQDTADELLETAVYFPV